MDNFIRNNYYLIFILFYASVVISFFFGEDSLGGAEHDYIYHLKFIELFQENGFIDGLKKFSKLDYEARNSPIFYIIFAYLNQFISLEYLKFFNTLVSLFISLVFFKCLELKYKNQNNLVLILISCIIFLSPTVRSLSIWPYPLLWGILLFIISIYYYLKFLDTHNKNNKFKFSFISTLLIILAAYLHPPLGLFNFFYLFYFWKFLKKNRFFLIVLANIFFSIPAVIFLLDNGILFFHKVEGENVDIFTTLNFFNKIIIISTIIFYFLMPIINPIKLTKEIFSKINFIKLLIFFAITIIFSLYFNYDFTEIHGGGFIHKASYLLFGNYLFLYIFFLISIM